MQLTLVVPGLLDVAASDDADAASTALARMLACSEGPSTHDGAIGVACAALGIARQRDWPLAPLLAVAANLDPGSAYWLVAEPVSLIVGQEDVRLAGLVDDLSGEESAALVATLRSHFSGDGLRFFTPRPERWLIAAARAQQLDTHPADDALGLPLSPFLPAGPDGARWRRWQSEMQMLLFEHPVNAARERDGRKQVNGIWLSYGGQYDALRVSPQIASLCADAVLPRAVAQACGVAVAPKPSSLAAWRDASPKSPSMVWVADVAANDAGAVLAALDRDWAEPLEKALAAHAIGAVAIVATGRRRALAFTPRRRSLVARWRNHFAPTRLSALLDGLQR